MNRSLMDRLTNLLNRRQLKDRLARVAMVLSCAAVFCVTYVLVAPVLTQEWPTVCGLEEHTHTDECYTVELREIPLDSQPGTETETEPKTEGHIHDESCYEEVTHRELVCDLAESEGHTHDDSCTETHRELVCGETESEGHHHGSGCYETEEVLACSDDSEDHVHDSGCYETIETLTCSESESDGHTHSDSCYETETTYTCGLSESEGHTHDDSCYEDITTRELVCGLEEARETEEPAETGTEPRYEEVRVLTCGKEEHTHEDSCYQQESDEARYFCGLDEHIHADSCYFESGDLRCTIPEHTHTDECLVRPTQLPEITDEFVCGLEEHTHTDECYTLDEATGELVLTCEKTEHVHTDECLTQVQPEIDPEAVELNETFTAESEDGAVILTLQVNGLVHLPEAEEPETADVIDETDAIDETDVIDETPETGFQLVLTESEDWDAYDEYTELASEEGEVLVMGVLDYTLTYNGQSVDLTECEIVAEVAPTEAFQQFMDDPQTLGLMTVTNELGEEETAAGGNMETCFTAYTEQRGRVAYSVTLGTNVTFYVQYYARMDRLVTENGEGAALNVIDTDNGGNGTGSRMPKNGEPQGTKTGEAGKTPIRNIYIGADGEVETKTVLAEIYKRGEDGKYTQGKGSEFAYFDAPGLQYFNMVSNVMDIQYTVDEVWIQKDGMGDPASTDPEDWLVCSYEEGVTRFTNRPETAANNSSYILLEQDDVIRLIYTPKEKVETFPVDFYDYDISDGKSAQGSKNMKTREGDAANGTNFGINAGTIPAGKARFGFGNKNTDTSTALSGGTWDNNGVKNLINAANASGTWGNYKDTSYTRCAFNLVSGMNEAGNDVIFSDGIIGPSLFGAKATTGKEKVEKVNEIQFKRKGDTYTLTGISDLSGLDTFSHPGIYDGVQNPTVIWSNNFWPLDNIYEDGTTGHDIMFGDGTQYRNGDKNKKFAANDDGKNHNSYFGMNFAVEFELTKNYIGPLEYYFFGDDDMWAFLSEVEPVLDANGKQVIDPVTGKGKTKIVSGSESKKIVDIGGLHSAVGQYVNLWDHVSTDSWEDNERRSYRLTFFYTERGAGGSTCWMQFTLPTVVGVDLDSQIKDLIKEDTGTIRIEKQMGGIESNEPFEFQLKLTGADNYKIEYLYRNADGTITAGKEEDEDAAIGDNGRFILQPGEIMVVHNLPESTEYTITEFKQGYHTEIQTVVGENGEPKIEKFAADEEAATTGNVTAGQLTWVTFTNSASYELPATGGSGTTIWYTMGVLSLLGAAFLMYKQLTKKEDEICA